MPKKSTKKVVETMAVKEVKNDDTVSINIEKLLIPFAILLAGLMISLAVIFSLKNTSGVNVAAKSDTTTNTDTTTTPTNNADDGKADISLDDDPYLGDKSKAKVAIVEFSDYECPFCKSFFTDTKSQIVKNYVDTGKAIFVYRDYPLSFHEPNATNEAMAANCVYDQGGSAKYFKYHDLLFQNTVANGKGVGSTAAAEAAKLKEFAGKVGVDVAKFTSCYDSKKFADEITKDEADGAAAGISGTPGFIIGKFDSNGNIKDGVVLSGAYPFASFQTAIDKILAE